MGSKGRADRPADPARHEQLLAADLVFDGPNDLVVDTDSMADFGADTRIRPAVRLDFGTTADVHQCGSFRDPKTTALIATALRIP